MGFGDLILNRDTTLFQFDPRVRFNVLRVGPTATRYSVIYLQRDRLDQAERRVWWVDLNGVRIGTCSKAYEARDEEYG